MNGICYEIFNPNEYNIYAHFNDGYFLVTSKNYFYIWYSNKQCVSISTDDGNGFIANIKESPMTDKEYIALRSRASSVL